MEIRLGPVIVEGAPKATRPEQHGRKQLWQASGQQPSSKGAGAGTSSAGKVVSSHWLQHVEPSGWMASPLIASNGNEAMVRAMMTRKMKVFNVCRASKLRIPVLCIFFKASGRSVGSTVTIPTAFLV